MGGDKLYHPECLVCSMCSERISPADGFAETSAGLTCAACCDSVKRQLLEMQELMGKGDHAAAGKIAAKLKEQGVSLPGSEKTEALLPNCTACGKPASVGRYGMLGDKLY